jgi:hypothetical protein
MFNTAVIAGAGAEIIEQSFSRAKQDGHNHQM